MSVTERHPTDHAIPGRDALRAAALAVAAVTAVFCIALTALMGGTWLRLHASDPLQEGAVQRLMDLSAERPEDDALKQQVRALDLVMRQAFFTSLEQVRIGGRLLLAGVVLLLVAVWARERLSPHEARPQAFPESSELWRTDRRSRHGLLWLSGAAGAAGLAVAVLTQQAVRLPSPAAGEKGGTVEGAVEQGAAAPAAGAGGGVAEWPAFRGPGGNGIAAPEASPPTDWDGASGRGIRWKTKVPLPGFSSPVVAGSRILITGADREQRVVYCFDANDGSLRWQWRAAGIPGSPAVSPEAAADTGYAAPTPATDGRHVTAVFASGDLVCLTMQGEPLWARNVGVPDNHYGHSSSLLIVDSLCVVQLDDNTDPRALAVSIKTGETVWEAERTTISWSSPICVDTGFRRELIMTDSEAVCSYVPGTGELLWREACLGAEVGPSAAFAAGRVFAANEYAQGCAIGVATAPGEPAARILWEWYGDLPSVASPVATTQAVFFASSAGVLSCVGAADGDTRWTHEVDRGFYASPILVRDLIYALDMGGQMHIVSAEMEYRGVAAPRLGERTVCTPAFVRDRVYVRGAEHLYCIQSPGTAGRGSDISE